jgi:hypothetical protein
MTEIDYQRQMEILSRTHQEHTYIEVVGVGATGSWVTLLLAKMGFQNIRVWDPDVVSAHNIPNQLYSPRQIDKLKVTSLQSMVNTLTGVKITAVKKKFTGKEPALGHVAFILVDSMEQRRLIWKNLQSRANPHILLESRMGLTQAEIYRIASPLERQQYQTTLEIADNDPRMERSACGSTMSAAPTAMSVASNLVWMLLDYLNDQEAEPRLFYTLTGHKFCFSTDVAAGAKTAVEEEEVLSIATEN